MLAIREIKLSVVDDRWSDFLQSKRSHSHGGLEARATINTAGSAAKERVYWHAHTPKA